MFDCDCCGECCCHLNCSDIYAKLDRGDGVCRYFDEGTALCTIYNARPVVCNVDAAYEKYFKNQMPLDEYYKLNYEACETLKECKAR